MHDTGFVHPLIRSIMDVRHTDQEEAVFRISELGPSFVAIETPHWGVLIVHKRWLTVYGDMERRFGLTMAEIESLKPGYVRRRVKR